MKKKHIVIAILLGLYLNSYSQNYNEILRDLSKESKGSYLKDFKFELPPNTDESYSLVLKKNTRYEFVYYKTDNYQNGIELFQSKGDQTIEISKSTGSTEIEQLNIKSNFKKEASNPPVSPKIIDTNIRIIKREYLIPETGVYHLFICNYSNKQLKSAVLLAKLEEIIPIQKQGNSQDTKKKVKSKTEKEYFFIVDEMPKFNGATNNKKSAEEFSKFIYSNLKYPKEVLDKNIKGRVFVQYIISEDGYIKEAKVVRGIHPALDQEALRLIYSSPKWEPGKLKGQNVNLMFTMPIEFKLP